MGTVVLQVHRDKERIELSSNRTTIIFNLKLTLKSELLYIHRTYHIESRCKTFSKPNSKEFRRGFKLLLRRCLYVGIYIYTEKEV